MNDLYEALEICLQDLEQGADMETVLSRYPDFADELRPILEGSIHARSMGIVAPSPDVERRNRSKVLQHAAQMREVKSSSSQRMGFASLRRIAVSLAVIAVLFMSGTGLVSAASTTLPGDNLYPVKRTWEDVLLWFTFDAQAREALEIEHENERFYELKELFAKGRSVEVDFSGTVVSQNQNEWIVNGIRVVITSQTEVRDGPIGVGSAVRVRGWTQGQDTVMAERIRLLSSDDKLPDIEYEHEESDNSNEGSGHQEEDNSGPGSGNEGPKIEETQTPDPDNSNSSNGNDSNDNQVDDSSNDNSGSDDNSNNNENDDSSDNENSGGNDNDDDDHGGNDNGDDSEGGGDNSGPGGGDDDDGGGGGDDD
jgi:uncharacterized membrane protein YgcG